MVAVNHLVGGKPLEGPGCRRIDRRHQVNAFRRLVSSDQQGGFGARATADYGNWQRVVESIKPLPESR